jgi:cell division septum initiation protein DivIVA
MELSNPSEAIASVSGDGSSSNLSQEQLLEYIKRQKQRIKSLEMKLSSKSSSSSAATVEAKAPIASLTDSYPREGKSQDQKNAMVERKKLTNKILYLFDLLASLMFPDYSTPEKMRSSVEGKKKHKTKSSEKKHQNFIECENHEESHFHLPLVVGNPAPVEN